MRSETTLLRDKNILVLDDNELIRQSLKLLFEEQGATVYTTGQLDKCTTVLQGLVQKGDAPLAIVLDVRLHNCFGLHALRRLHDSLGSQNVPIIVASHGFKQAGIREMQLYGVVGYVQKRVLVDKLYDFVLDVLNTAYAEQDMSQRPALKVG